MPILVIGGSESPQFRTDTFSHAWATSYLVRTLGLRAGNALPIRFRDRKDLAHVGSETHW